MRIKAKSKEYHLIVRVRITFTDTRNDPGFSNFLSTHIRGFLKPTAKRKNLYEYTGPVGISLSERLKNPICKRDFLLIIEQLVIALQKIEKTGLMLSNLMLDIRYIYINVTTKELQFIYLPCKANSAEVHNAPQSCFDSIVYSARPMASQDEECISRFAHFVNGMHKFELSSIERFVEREDKGIVNFLKRQHVGQSGFMTDKRQKYYDHYESKDHRWDDSSKDDATDLLDEDGATDLLDEDGATDLLDDDFATGLLDEDEQTGLLDDEDDATGLLYEEGSDETGLLCDSGSEATGLLCDDGSDATGLLDENRAMHMIRYPTLTRKFGEEVVSINKPVFRVGKERSCVDFCVSGNNNISRSHVDVITRGRQYYIVDLNSTNGTYVNGMKVLPQCETELRDGDLIQLANEEFVFRL